MECSRITLQKIKKNGCIEVPKRFRDRISASGTKTVMLFSSDKCLLAYDTNEWEKLRDCLYQASEKSRCLTDFSQDLFNRTKECSCDDKYHLSLPMDLRKLAEIKTDVALVEKDDHFEVWAADAPVKDVIE